MSQVGIVAAQKSGPFLSTGSFMNVPHSTNPVGARAAILGVPFDCGTHAIRIGARYGPTSIREQSLLVRPYQPPQAQFDPLALLKVVDVGDADVVPSVIEASYANIEAAARVIVAAGAAPVAMGGDGAVSLPLIRALKDRYPDLVVLHIDAHTDTYPGEGPNVEDRYNTATTFTRAAEEGLVDVAASFHIGARGPIGIPGVFDYTRNVGYQLIDGKDLFARGIDVVAAMLRDQLAERPVYLCFDMDFFDPSCAPGVCTPAWGGANAREGLSFLQQLAGINVVAADVNTVSPPHDLNGQTAFLAATVVLECLTLLCHARANRELVPQ